MSDILIRNDYKETLFVAYPDPRVVSEVPKSPTATQIADRYILQNRVELGIAKSKTEEEASRSLTAQDDDPVIVFVREDDIRGSRVLVYDQTIMGLSIFQARMGVHVSDEMAVLSVQSSMHANVNVSNPEEKAAIVDTQLTNDKLREILGVDLRNLVDGRIEHQVVYRFEPEQRIEEPDSEAEGCFGQPHSHTLDLPEMPSGITKSRHYIVNEVLFRASLHKEESPVNWRALVEPQSGAILYIRALVACATGMVFIKDPQTQTGGFFTGASSDVELNPLRSSVVLSGLIRKSPQPPEGEYVKLADTMGPVVAPPTVPTPAGAFNYNVRSDADNFSAVNAYYHCDKLFRTMIEYGFDLAAYFNGTSFPVPVDHRGQGNMVNAQAPGNAGGTGLGELRFGLLQAGKPVGISTSNRICWHEFGHALLWDHVNLPNFGFAHSAGDSLAAILNDPGSKEQDRFDTFPWLQEATPINRRHDRTVTSGWAWFGPKYDNQYRGEQILCTTLFRLYQSIGGDAQDVATKTRAAETVAYLIIKAIGLLTSTTSFPEVFVTNLQNADRTTTYFKGIPGGALHKVVRWAFEKQGLFQHGARPGQANVQTEGDPPDVDVYIDDGRNGGYEYRADYWSCRDMWVRNAADGGLTHQRPLVGISNFMYIRVKNRGLLSANNVRVDAYHCLPGTGLRFPDDWVPMATPSLPALDAIAAGGETIVGPFAFVPTQAGHECLLAVAHADGDSSNRSTIANTIPASRFVPFDNNIGQRNVCPVFPSLKHLVELFSDHHLWVRNPLKKPAVCRIEVVLPQFLRRLGWELILVSAGGCRFELGALSCREVVLTADPGINFSMEMFRRAVAEGDHEITILTYIDDELSGGMTYPMSFEAETDSQ